MKLWECYGSNREEHWQQLIAAETEKEALDKFYETVAEDGGYFYGDATAFEIDEVDGYKMVLVKEEE